MLQFSFSHRRQIPVFREVPADEAVGVFIQPTFPGGIRMSEVGAGIKVAGHTRMIDKFTTIVIGSRMNPGLVWREALFDRVSNQLGRLL